MVLLMVVLALFLKQAIVTLLEPEQQQKPMTVPVLVVESNKEATQTTVSMALFSPGCDARPGDIVEVNKIFERCRFWGLCDCGGCDDGGFGTGCDDCDD